MPRPFAQLLASFEAEGQSHRAAAIAALVGLVVAWSGWAALDQVDVLVSSDRARIEAEGAAHPVEAQVSGRVARHAVGLGQRVRRGEVLVELDATLQALELQRERTLCQNLQEELAALDQALSAEQQALRVDRRALSAATTAAAARARAAEASSSVAEEERRMAAGLRQEGLASRSELLGVQGKAEAQRGQAQALRAELHQVREDRQARLSDRSTTLVRLERERVEMQGQQRVCQATLARLAHDIELRSARAPVDGFVRDVTPAPDGTQVAPGHRFALVIPQTTIRIVADFDAPQAVGRLRSGQPARLRLEAYPWTQHGVVEVRVSSVATEPRGGRVRVEFDITRVPDSVHLEHGLHGAIEVVTEHTSPARLLLRLAGQMLVPATAPGATGP